VTLNDPDHVRDEYASEAGLLGRRAAYQWATGPDALQLLFETIAALRPSASVVAIDISPRMVELARARGVDARLGDVQELPFGSESFDLAVAAWMLYHVPDVDLALAELARVLQPGGQLVAVTNYLDHLGELRALSGENEGGFESAFSGDNGRGLLRPHFAAVDEQDAGGSIRFPDRASVVAYLESSISLDGAEARLPDFEPPFVVLRHPTIFVATKS
jgi:SAM-dependent methyltransferase